MKKTNPTITVLMSVYNSEMHLREAIESILNQTFRDFEFLIFNDASTDNSPNILQEYALDDKRIRLVDNKVNLGLTQSLNKGIELARGEYIARQDADDISFAHRLEKQLSFFEKHPEVGLLGSHFIEIDEHGKRVKLHNPPQGNFQLLWRLNFGNTFAHSSIMIRKILLTKNSLCYNIHYRYSQDYEFWTRLCEYTKCDIVPEVLLYYRTHSEAISQQKREEQEELAFQVAWKQMHKYANISETEAKVLRNNRGGVGKFVTVDSVRTGLRALDIMKVMLENQRLTKIEYHTLYKEWLSRSLSHISIKQLWIAWRGGLIQEAVLKAPVLFISHIVYRILRKSRTIITKG
jgi:glycosyltransferase involved in cell wall biosynthesis